jgi:hypothetical protein
MLEVVTKSKVGQSAVWLLNTPMENYEMVMMTRSILISFLDIMSYVLFQLRS